MVGIVINKICLKKFDIYPKKIIIAMTLFFDIAAVPKAAPGTPRD